MQLENQDGLGSTTPGVTGASTTTVSSGASIKIVGNNYVIPEVQEIKILRRRKPLNLRLTLP